MTIKLSVRREKWIKQFQPTLIKGESLNPNAASEIRYYQRLERLIDRMITETEREIKKLFDTDHAQEFFAQDASVSSQARILTNALQEKFNSLFAVESKPIAEKMVKDADKNSESSVQSSIQKLSGGLNIGRLAATGELSDILKATVTENVSLIKSISSQYLDAVQGAVMRSITTGNGLQDLVPFLEKYKGITKRRAHLISLDQTRKAYNGLNKGRMQKIGIEEYEWLHTSGSDHPRKEHIRMSGNVYRFDDPPVIDSGTGERGIPGQLPYCRCRMIPVIKFGIVR